MRNSPALPEATLPGTVARASVEAVIHLMRVQAESWATSASNHPTDTMGAVWGDWSYAAGVLIGMAEVLLEEEVRHE